MIQQNHGELAKYAIMELIDLFEHRAASLYHGCGVGAAIHIIARNIIEDRTEHLARPGDPFRHDVSGVSFSRSYLVAKQFGDVVLQLDWRKLATRFKIEPIDYWAHSKSPEAFGLSRRFGKFAEAEEFVLGPITQAMRYVEAIHLTRKAFHRIEVGGDERVMALIRHPLLRIDGPPPPMFQQTTVSASID